MHPEKKKRQHYVPRLILREFSTDRLSTSVLVLESGEVIHRASIATQCYENYFYGEDGKVENAIADVEAEFSTLMGDRSPARLESLSDVQLAVLSFFVQLQRGRTVAAAKQMQAMNDAFMRVVFGRDPRLRELGIDLEKVSIGYERPQAEALYYAAMTWPMLLDLKVKFLVPSGRLGFVVSDHPVIDYNQYAEHHSFYRNLSGTTGLGLKGLQLFLPLAPRLCIAMFDSGTYEYGSPKRRTSAVGLRDVRLLNTLQAVNAEECIYFDPTMMPSDDLDALIRARRKFDGWRTVQTFQGEEVPQPDGTTSQIVGFTAPEVRVGTQFGFARVLSKSTPADPQRLPMRSRELLEATHEHAERMRAWRQAAEAALAGRAR